MAMPIHCTRSHASTACPLSTRGMMMSQAYTNRTHASSTLNAWATLLRRLCVST